MSTEGRGSQDQSPSSGGDLGVKIEKQWASEWKALVVVIVDQCRHLRGMAVSRAWYYRYLSSVIRTNSLIFSPLHSALPAIHLLCPSTDLLQWQMPVTFFSRQPSFLIRCPYCLAYLMLCNSCLASFTSSRMHSFVSQCLHETLNNLLKHISNASIRRWSCCPCFASVA